MSYYSKNTQETLRLLLQAEVRVRATEGTACISEGPPFCRHRGTVNQASWKKILKNEWVEIDPSQHASPGWTVWKISEAGRKQASPGG